MTKTHPDSQLGNAAARHPREQPRRWALRAAAVGYSAAWIVGLLLASSTTDVASSGSAIIRDDAPQAAAIAVQFLLTEGVAALALLVIVIGLWQRAAPGVLRRLILISGASAATISLAQTVLGVCLVELAVRESNARLASSLTVALNELDGLKMALLTVTAFAVSGAQWRRRLGLPFWLLPTGIATGAALVVSALGYLARSNALSAAAWVSLPLLLVYVTAVGLCVRSVSQR